MVELGSCSQREIDDVMLTRYACYLIAQKTLHLVFIIKFEHLAVFNDIASTR